MIDKLGSYPTRESKFLDYSRTDSQKSHFSQTPMSHNQTYTMSAKSLGTLSVIYAVDELQNSLHRTTMLFEGDTNSTGRRNDVFPNS